jgi:hypothetical protein
MFIADRLRSKSHIRGGGGDHGNNKHQSALGDEDYTYAPVSPTRRYQPKPRSPPPRVSALGSITTALQQHHPVKRKPTTRPAPRRLEKSTSLPHLSTTISTIKESPQQQQQKPPRRSARLAAQEKEEKEWPVGHTLGNIPASYVSIKLWRLAPFVDTSPSIDMNGDHNNPLSNIWFYRSSLKFHPLLVAPEQEKEMSFVPVYPSETLHSVAESVSRNQLRYAYDPNADSFDVMNQVYGIEIRRVPTLVYNDIHVPLPANYPQQQPPTPPEVFLIWFPNFLLQPSPLSSSKKTSKQPHIVVSSSTERSQVLQWPPKTSSQFYEFVKQPHNLILKNTSKIFGGRKRLNVPKYLTHIPHIVFDTNWSNFPVSHPQAHEYSAESWRTRTMSELGAKRASDIPPETLTLRSFPTYKNYLTPTEGIWNEATQIDKGHFGFVLSVPWKDSKGRIVDMVVKMVHPQLSQAERDITISEATLPELLNTAIRAKDSRRARLVEIYGWTIYGGHFGVVMEKVKGGNMMQKMDRLITAHTSLIKRLGLDPDALADEVAYSMYADDHRIQAVRKSERKLAFTSLEMIADLSRALSVLHDIKRVHRDVKPENVFIDEDDRIKLGDFGMLAPQGYYLNYAATRRYAPPDVLALKDAEYVKRHGDRVLHKSGAADIYSLAVMMKDMMEAGVKLPKVVKKLSQEILSVESMYDIKPSAHDIARLITDVATTLK